MKRKMHLCLAAFIILEISIFVSPVGSQQPVISPLPASDEALPVDPLVTTGTLGNGLKYYIRENQKPEKRAHLWLVVNAGSVLEEDDQRGLAHFVEHMAFNGTRNFEKHEIINYLEKAGMKFGPEINAYTNFDETVYMLQVPTDSMEVVVKGLQILCDWARYISFEAEEVEKEKGVIIEEWRLGRGAEMRMLDRQLPVLLNGSKYADRVPIGVRTVIEGTDHTALKRFYDDWYRPDLMAVIAVGDFNKTMMEEMIIRQFGYIPGPEKARERISYDVPGHEPTLVAIATDPEASGTSVSVYYKAEPYNMNSREGYRRMLTEGLVVSMLNLRLYEKVKTANPPFLYAYASRSGMVRTKNIYSLNAAVKEDAIITGLEALLTEAVRVKKFGFTVSELERTRTNMLRQYEQALQESDKTQSSSYAAEYARNFLENEPVPGIEYEYTMARDILPSVTVNEVNAIIGNWLSEQNRVILVNAPQKEGISLPDEARILAVFDTVEQANISGFDDDVSALPLVEKVPTPVDIITEKESPAIGVTEWTLANGIRVVLKPTDFKNDEMLFQAISSGGSSLVADSDYMSAAVASDIIRESGIGQLSYLQLYKKLAGKVVSVFPYISTYSEGISGSASPADMETMFQLIYLFNTAPRFDMESYHSYINRIKGFIENRSASPESAFYDSLQVTMAQYHPRERPWSFSLIDDIHPERIYDIYTSRFQNNDAFTYVLVGNFNPETIRPYVTAYLGNLPHVRNRERWADPGIYPPKGVVKKTVYRGIEPAGQVVMAFTGEQPWSRENSYALSSISRALQIRLREILREDLGGTYSVRVSGSLNRIPREEYRVNISFGCDPSRVDELVQTVFRVIDTMQVQGPGSELIEKVRESQKREWETNMKENQYWLNQLVNSYFYESDPAEILNTAEFFKSLNEEKIRQAARQYFDRNNYVEMVLLPEKTDKEQ